MKKKQKKPDSGILRLEGELTIQHAGQIKEKLLRVFPETDGLSLDLEGVTKADVACLQVLCAAHRTFLASNKELKTIGRVAEPFERAVNESGYRRTMGCHANPERNCLWVIGGSRE
jgi:anti-anti-sigma regulatory factor